ncbi:phage terminase large subunit [Croceibacterium sp. TMG7-5b_MA50]|uniref:phage terminase large subunit n=1 Tax=Croceibacterium sp. TMG7-5b_MA50 TaxID=3121290 RepID=UPI003221B267
MSPLPPGIGNAEAFIEELQRRDFGSFLIGAFPKIHGGANLLSNWHHDAISHQLDQVHRGVSRRLLITLPPRNLKSVMVSVAWVAWCLGRDPTLSFVCVSYSQELALKHARDCRSLIQTRWYKALFPGTVIASNRSAVHDFETTRIGGRLATSVGGTLTGRGGDIIILDDPINPKEANSQTLRDGVNDWFGSTLASRLNDKSRGAIVTVMQRLHQYDLAGMLLEAGGWDHLSLPAIAPEPVTVSLTRGRTYHRRSGEVLHAAHEPLAALMDIKRLQGSVYFEAQYQQTPVPAEGNVVKADWLRSYEDSFDPASAGRIVQSWDTASKDGALNDYSVGITAHVHRGMVRILDVFRRKLNFPELKRHVIRLAQHHHATVLLIEDQASGQQLIQTLRAEKPRHVPAPIARKPEGDKLSRMLGVSGQIEGGQLLLPRDAPWLAEFKSELLSFPSGRHDDQVDALTQLMSWALRDQHYSEYIFAGPILIYADEDGVTHSSEEDAFASENIRPNDPWL